MAQFAISKFPKVVLAHILGGGQFLHSFVRCFFRDMPTFQFLLKSVDI